MPLTLTILNCRTLDNGSPLSLVLDRQGAIIGRSATSDWCLPDPSRHISSLHCEIRFVNECYELHDYSTNGTFLQGQNARLAGPHTIRQGDVFVIGPFEISAALDEAAASAAREQSAAPPSPEWKGWTASAAQGGAAPPATAQSWDAQPFGSAASGSGPLSASWAPPEASRSWATAPFTTAQSQAPSPVSGASSASSWGTTPTPFAPPSAPPEDSAWVVHLPTPAVPASPWSSPPQPISQPSAEDVWGKFSQSNVVDWARGGFGQPASPPIAEGSGATADLPPIACAPADTFAVARPAVASSLGVSTQSALPEFASALGVDVQQLSLGEMETLAKAGGLLRQLVAGMVVMLEARARAKSQLGAQTTSLEFDGNNPLKFARTPEQALAQLLNAPERGFMGSERAIEDAFKDLQAHQMATLSAMQGALRATLDRFSPQAISARAEGGGLLEKILPGAREAALWAAYENEFSGVALGSDEAFMDVFAKEFKRAYEEIARKR